MLLVRLICDLSARGAASRRWKFPIFWERAKCTTLNRRWRINVGARTNRKSSTCSRSLLQIAPRYDWRHREIDAIETDIPFFDVRYEICQNCRDPVTFAPKAASSIIHDPDVIPTNRRQDDEIQDSRRAGIADSRMRRDCRFLTFYDLPTSSRAVVKSFDIDYSIAGRIWQDLGNHTYTHTHKHTDTRTHMPFKREYWRSNREGWQSFRRRDCNNYKVI